MMKRYPNKIKLLFTDTDSLVYEIETEDLYNDLQEDKDLYDFSDYSKFRFLYSEAWSTISIVLHGTNNNRELLE